VQHNINHVSPVFHGDDSTLPPSMPASLPDQYISASAIAAHKIILFAVGFIDQVIAVTFGRESRTQ
jgi:hypothetical protein